MTNEERSEAILAEFGLTEMCIEPIYRERMPADERPGQLTRDERESVLVLAEMLRERPLR